MHALNVHGAGLGLRRELIPALRAAVPAPIRFFEVAPENWLDLGGATGKALRHFSERFPIVCHGLSLSLGGPGPLDEVLLGRIGRFMRAHGMQLYTEHLAYTTDDGHLYDLLPIPFTHEAVRYVAARIRRAQEILETRIAIENASYYVASPIGEMDEAQFVRAVLEEADCWLHLDVNNVYVNSVNFGFDPVKFLQALPAERVVYLHTAGHFRESDSLLVDTHGAAVADPVWSLLETAYETVGVHPTLLERDFNIPPLDELVAEVARIDRLQQARAPAYGQRRHG